MPNYQQLISKNLYAKALEELEKLLIESPNDEKLLFDRGKLRWRLGDRSGATSDYAKATLINPNGPAFKALENARDIADFFNPDLYNP